MPTPEMEAALQAVREAAGAKSAKAVADALAAVDTSGPVNAAVAEDVAAVNALAAEINPPADG